MHKERGPTKAIAQKKKTKLFGEMNKEAEIYFRKGSPNALQIYITVKYV